MKSNLIAIGSGVLAVTALGVFGMDRLNREPRPGATVQPVQVAVAAPATSPGKTTIHYQMDPDLPPLPPPPVENSKANKKSEPQPATKDGPPILPSETPAPPLLSTGELEKKLKSSLDKLQKALPTLPSGEESGLPEPGKTTLNDKTLSLPPAPDRAEKKLDAVVPPPPPATNAPIPPSLPPVSVGPPSDQKPAIDGPRSNQSPIPSLPEKPTIDNKVLAELAPPSLPSAPPISAGDKKPDVTLNKDSAAPPIPAAPRADPTAPPPPSLGGNAPPSPPVGTSTVPPPSIGGFTIPAPKVEAELPKKNDAASGSPSAQYVPSPTAPSSNTTAVRNVSATVASTDEFQKRLIDLELKYLQSTSDELSRRLGQMPENSADRRRLVAEQQRVAERIRRLQRAADLAAAQHIDDAGKTISGDSPWTMHLETADGKTVLQAVVHRKARFKIVCDRLDLQSPRGTVLAVGHVNISGEGFQGTCDRLSIPLHEDRLILEGGAEVGVRTQAMAIIEGRDGQPPSVEPRRLDEQTTSPTPILHLKGDHLDLRWSDLQPGPVPSARADEPIDAKADAKAIRATPGPMVKVAFNSAANEKWSDWGTLRRTKQPKDGQPEYVIADATGLPIAYVHTPAGLSLAEYVGKRVSVFGRANRAEERLGQEVRGDGRPVLTFTASHVAWE